MSLAAPADWALLALKAALSAGVVVTAATLAERSRPIVAAAILSLPISAGPAYVVLALQQDAAFVAAASAVALPLNLCTIALVLVYAPLARAGRSLGVSYGAAAAVWVACAALVTQTHWPWLVSLTVLAVVSAASAWAARRWTDAPRRPAERHWYDVPLRAGVVGALVVGIALLSETIGPRATGFLTLLPVGYSSFILLMHGRLGGPAVAAALANGLTLLPGFALGLLALHLAAAAGHVWWGLAAFGLVPVVWSMAALKLQSGAA